MCYVRYPTDEFESSSAGSTGSRALAGRRRGRFRDNVMNYANQRLGGCPGWGLFVADPLDVDDFVPLGWFFRRDHGGQGRRDRPLHLRPLYALRHAHLALPARLRGPRTARARATAGTTRPEAIHVEASAYSRPAAPTKLRRLSRCSYSSWGPSPSSCSRRCSQTRPLVPAPRALVSVPRALCPGFGVGPPRPAFRRPGAQAADSRAHLPRALEVVPLLRCDAGLCAPLLSRLPSLGRGGSA